MSVVTLTPPRDGETWRQKLVRRFKEEPLVPIGTALTTFALIMASTKLGKKGESKSMNRWFRARIIFQGATIGAIVAGSYAVNKRAKEDADPAAPLSPDEVRNKERVEFEERLKNAVDAYEMEKGSSRPNEKVGIFARIGLGRGPAGSVTAAQGTSPTPPPPPSTSIPTPTSNPSTAGPVSDPTPSAKSAWNWFGKSSSSGSGSESK